jgi:putative membrane protein
MNAKQASLIAVIVASTLGVAQAQTPAQNQSTDPSSPEAASSPHQREATRTPATEAPAGGSPEASASSTPHQQHATGDKMGGDKTKMASAPNAADPATFTRMAALGGMTEVELGKVAQTKSQDASVKKFGEQMVKDHGKANKELASIAAGKGMKVPTSLDSEHQAIVKKLSAKSGSDFDTAYSQQMVEDHAKTIALFEAAQNSSDAEIAAFAKKTLPTLKEHKEMADSLPGATRSADASSSSSHHQ